VPASAQQVCGNVSIGLHAYPGQHDVSLHASPVTPHAHASSLQSTQRMPLPKRAQNPQQLVSDGPVQRAPAVGPSPGLRPQQRWHAPAIPGFAQRSFASMFGHCWLGKTLSDSSQVSPASTMPFPHTGSVGPPPLQASQQLGAVPTLAEPPDGARQSEGSRLIEHDFFPLRDVRQQVTKPGRRPQTERAAQRFTAPAHAWFRSPSFTRVFTTPAAQLV
jgi:hypothetical protein